MREILFRGKRIDNGAWVYGFVRMYGGKYPPQIATLPDEDGVCKHCEVVDCTVGQYTGLTDKNGKRIWEGDIIPVWEQGEEYPYKVVYCADCFMLSMLDSEQGSYPLSVKCNTSEVIGNIHDNPKLIEGGTGDGN